MPVKIGCSVCRAVFEAGPSNCPNCNLPLTAQALPVVRKPFLPLWGWVAAAFIGLILICNIGTWIAGH